MQKTHGAQKRTLPGGASDHFKRQGERQARTDGDRTQCQGQVRPERLLELVGASVELPHQRQTFQALATQQDNPAPTDKHEQYQLKPTPGFEPAKGLNQHQRKQEQKRPEPCPDRRAGVGRTLGQMEGGKHIQQQRHRCQ